MRKFIGVLLSVLCICCAAIGLTGCKKDKHIHAFNKQVITDEYKATDATCTEKATYYYSCSCGEKGAETFEYGSSLGHSFTNYVSDNNATCTQDGTKTAKCNRCDKKDTVKDTDSKLNHSYTEQIVSDEYLAAPATCNKKATYYYSCSCGEKGTETFEYGSITNHNFVNGRCTYCGKEQESSKGLAFTLLNDGAYEVSGIGSCTDTEIVIPSVYNNKPVTSIGEWAFWGCIGLTSVTIPESVTSIGNYAFAHCTELTSITIGNSVTSIGDVAFYGCTGLETITVNKGNTKYHIKDNCLIETESKTLVLGCKNSIIPIDGSVTSIGNYAFHGCVGLTIITIPNSVTSIGDWAFSYCEGLTSITVGNSITSIGNHAFRGCVGLTIITIPNSVTSIGDAAFYGCYRLIEVYNKSSLSITAGSENNGCVACYAKNVYKDEGGSKLSTDEKGYLIYTDEEEKILVAYTGKESTLTLPSDITQINQCAFSGCSGLTSVTIGNSVTSIGSGAFEYCSGLTSITIPNSVTCIGDSAFYGCSGLMSITIPDGVTSIGYSAFIGCYKLVEVINKSGLNITKGSSDNGYIACYALNVKEDGTSDIVNKDGYLFYTYDNVNYLVAYVGSNTDLTLPDDYNGQNYKLNNYAFYNCSGLTSVTIPDSVTSIGDGAFEDCSGLTSVTIGNRVTSIGDGAFV